MPAIADKPSRTSDSVSMHNQRDFGSSPPPQLNRSARGRDPEDLDPHGFQNFRPRSIPNARPKRETGKLPEEDIHSSPTSTNSDKPIIEESPESPPKIDSQKSSWDLIMKHIDSVEMGSCYAAIAANVIGALLQISKVSKKTKEFFPTLVNFITNLSFLPYAMSGAKNGYIKKNPFQTAGFIMEAASVWSGNLMTKYLIRGPATGTDQIWVAVDPNLPEIKDGKFSSWGEGFTKTLRTAWKLLKQIVMHPIQTLWTLDMSKGHHALLSSFLDIVAGLGYALTGNEKVFGSCRDLASWLFDVAMLFSSKMQQKAAGALFIAESVLDFAARFTDNNFSRFCVNHLAHASGRIALTLYKNSDSVADPSQIKAEKQAPRPEEEREEAVKTANLNLQSA